MLLPRLFCIFLFSRLITQAWKKSSQFCTQQNIYVQKLSSPYLPYLKNRRNKTIALSYLTHTCSAVERKSIGTSLLICLAKQKKRKNSQHSDGLWDLMWRLSWKTSQVRWLANLRGLERWKGEFDPQQHFLCQMLCSFVQIINPLRIQPTNCWGKTQLAWRRHAKLQRTRGQSRVWPLCFI